MAKTHSHAYIYGLTVQALAQATGSSLDAHQFLLHPSAISH